MHPLHDYIARQLSEKLKSKRVVVWYDPRREFAPFVGELRGAGEAAMKSLVPVTLGGVAAHLAEYSGSYLELRMAVEPLVSGDTPDLVVLYLPGVERDRRGSVLMELEKAGECYEPQLKRLARNVLKERYTEGVIDEFLKPDGVGYDDLAQAASETSSAEPPSMLKAVFKWATGGEPLELWLIDDKHDAELEAKQAMRELATLLRSRVGLELPDGASFAKARSIALRYVLANEFRSDLKCAPPAALDGVAAPPKKDHEQSVRALAKALRRNFPAPYMALADRIEKDLHLDEKVVPAKALGSIDTFRFEERALLAYCGELVAEGEFDEALTIVAEREQSFWLDREVGRKAQWEVCRRMAELGVIAKSVRSAISKAGLDPGKWIDAYTSKDGWYRLDQAQRRLEALVARLDDESERLERPLGLVRRAYEDACHAMAEGFARALDAAGWAAGGSLHQTRIYSEVVSPSPKPVAYFLVDALRYEMGVELVERLPQAAEVRLRHAVGALPSITPIGMAALQPEASASFAVVEQERKLGARIEGVFLPDLAARKKFAASRVPKLVDVLLDDLLSLQPSKLAKKVEGAQVVVVRSQEIDHAGETSMTVQARQIMETVIDNIARAIRKLAIAGVEHSVVAADHGHLFFADDRDESMRLENPGGDEVDLHRRCWIGRGGSTPAGCVRVLARALGYDSDLNFVFPVGSGVFKAGGGLAYGHGGPSLQEIVIPVLTVRFKAPEGPRSRRGPISIGNPPPTITNRIFSVEIQSDMTGGGVVVRPLLIAEGKQVGAACMAVGADFDRDTGCLTLKAGGGVTVAFLLNDATAKSLRVVFQDPTTDAELYRSPQEIPITLMV